MSLFKKPRMFNTQKYHNKPVIVDDIKFASKKEAEHYLFLKKEEECGRISNLKTQVKIEIIPAIYEDVEIQLKTKVKKTKKMIQKPIFYIADFSYVLNGKEVISDVKGSLRSLTKVYILKRKLLFALKGIKINEVYNPHKY